jgi:hypothetical protein
MHFLLQCIKYDHKRWALVQQVKKRKKKMMMEMLLEDPEMAIPMANYVHGTGRFKNKPGEHTQTQTVHTMQGTHSR